MDAAGSSKDAGENKDRLESDVPINTGLSKDSVDVAQKIDKKLEDSALHEKGMSETNSPGMSLQYEELKARLTATNKSLVEKGNQVVYLSNRLDQTTSNITSLENELVCLRSERNVAIDERNETIYALETKTAELERLKTKYSETKTEIQKAVNEKIMSIALTDELQSKARVTQVEKNELERERNFLNSQIKCLHDELDKVYNDLQTRSVYNSQDVLTLTTQLDKKTEEMKNADDKTAHLEDLIKTLNETVDTLRAKLKESELDIPIREHYQKELDAKEKAANLYKNMQEEAEAKLNKMEDVSTQLRQLLRETNDKYNDLELKHKQFEMDNETLLEKKNEVIASLKAELEKVTKQNLHNFLSELAPSAAATIKLMKPEMSLTQLYFQVVKATDDLAKEKQEKQELQKKESLLERQVAQYEETFETHRHLTEKIDSQVQESNSLKEVNTELLTQANQYKIENDRLKGELRDLGYQVCFLLNKMEECRIESMSESKSSNNENVPDTGSRALITFSDIQELQTNNQKLLRMVRDLKEKLEEFENYKKQVNATDDYKKEILTLKDEICKQTEWHSNMFKTLIRQRDTFEKLYKDYKESKRQECTEIMNSSLEVPDKQGEHTSMETISHEEKLKVEKELESLKEEFNVYKEERANNENMLIEQMDSMRQEILKLTGINCKSAITIEGNNERVKTYKSNIDTYKSQIKCLEESNKIYDNIIAKHEISLQSLRDLVLSSQKHIATMDVKNASLNSEIELLKNLQRMMKNENDFLYRERLHQTDTAANFEILKISMQREQLENQTKLETQIAESSRDCSTLLLRLQEEQDSFRELSSHLERLKKAGNIRMLEEKNVADALRLEISQLRQQIAKLENKLIGRDANSNDPTIDLVKEIEDLKNKILQKDIEIKALEGLLDVAKQSEKERAFLSEEYKIYKNESEEKMTQFDQKIQVLHEYCSKLESELSSLRPDEENLKNSLETTNELLTNEQLKDALNRTREKLASARSELTKSAEIQKATTDNYHREIFLHSSDIQALSKVREELSQIQAQVKEMIAIRDNAVTTLEQEKGRWEKQEMLLQSESEQLLLRLENLNSQNSLLHDQIKNFSSTECRNDFINSSNVNTSIGNTEEVKSSVQLLQIITLLRQEKDIASANYDISKAEAMRFKLKLENMKIRVDQMKSDSSLKRKRYEKDVATVNTQPDSHRILETHNALIDSNRILRIERDSLLVRVEALTVSTKALQEQLLPLQNKVNALTSANENLQAENRLVKDDSTKFISKVNSDDWNRLQNERASLVKLLTKESNNNTILNEELVSMKIDKAKFEEEHNALLESTTNLKTELSQLKADLSNKDACLLEARTKECKIILLAKKYKALHEGLVSTVENEKNKTQSQLKSEKSRSESLKTELETLRNANVNIQIILKQAKDKQSKLIKSNNDLTLELGRFRSEVETLEQSNRYEQDARLAVIMSQCEHKVSSLEAKNKQTLAENNREIESLQEMVSLLQRQLSSHTTTTNQQANTSCDPTANINLSAGEVVNGKMNDEKTERIYLDSRAREQDRNSEAEQSAGGSAEQTPGKANAPEKKSVQESLVQETVPEAQDSATMEYLGASSPTHSLSPEIVPSMFRVRTRSATNTTKSASTSGPASASQAAGAAAQPASCDVTTSQATRTIKRTYSLRKSVEPKRIKLQVVDRLPEVEQQVTTSTHSEKTAEPEKKNQKDKKSKAQEEAVVDSTEKQEVCETAQEKVVGETKDEKTVGETKDEETVGETKDEETAGETKDEETVGETKQEGAGKPPATPPPVEATTTGSEQNTAQLSGAGEGGDSVVPPAPEVSVAGSDDGAQSGFTGATSASVDAEGEANQSVAADMPLLSPENTAQLSDAGEGGDSVVPPAPEVSVAGSDDGAQSGSTGATSASVDAEGEATQSVAADMPPLLPDIIESEDEALAAEIVRGDLHPPLIRPQGAPPYWNHQRDEGFENEGSIGRTRGSHWQPNRFNPPDYQGSQRNRRTRTRSRNFRRPFF